MGQARVDKLLELYDLEVEWKAFELHPGVPPDGMPIPFDPERLAAGRASFRRMADEAGLPYGERTRWYDSGPAHEAYLWADALGVGDAFKRAVFEAYFVHDRNIGSPEVLAGIAGELGLDADDVRRALADGRHRDDVRSQYEEARQVGVTGVPTFVADDRYALVGAHPLENLERLMEAVGAMRRS